jgi:predicted Zn finger-like uncharacterized protein
MLLATRCPFCETVFRLQAAQLSLRRGLVRCGHCNEVFDASGSLFDVTEGGDFSAARPISAAAAMESLPGARPESPGSPQGPQVPIGPKGPDFSAEAWDPWAPAPDASFDDRLLHNARNVPLQTVATGAGVAVTPRHVAEPEFPPRAEPHAPATASQSHPADQEPVLADAPLDPFAYDADTPADEAPNVWRKNERSAPTPGQAQAQSAAQAQSPFDQPLMNETAPLHGIPDNEPHFGTTSIGAAGLGAAGLGAAGLGTTTGPGAAPTGAPAFDATTGGPAASRPASAGSSGQPFSVNPVNHEAEPFPVTREQRRPEPRRVGWIVGGTILAVLLVIALLAQLAWWQRETVMVYAPSSQPIYAKLCAQLGCQISPPHDIDGLQVEPSDLRQVDGPHKLELKMPLRNRFNVALAYPAIELTLLDDQNNVALRRVLWPQDYVPPGTRIAGGLPARSTQTMIVHLDTGDAIATNFRVQIFYP